MLDLPIGQQLRTTEWKSVPPKDLPAVVDDFCRRIEAAIASDNRAPDLWEAVCLRRACAAAAAGQRASAIAALEAALRPPAIKSMIDGDSRRVA